MASIHMESCLAIALMLKLYLEPAERGGHGRNSQEDPRPLLRHQPMEMDPQIRLIGPSVAILFSGCQCIRRTQHFRQDL